MTGAPLGPGFLRLTGLTAGGFRGLTAALPLRVVVAAPLQFLKGGARLSAQVVAA